MDRIQNEFYRVLNDLLDSVVTEDELESIVSSMPDKLSKLIDDLPGILLCSIKKDAFSGGLARHRQNHNNFLKENSGHWQKGFDVLELMVELCFEVGSSISKRLEGVGFDDKGILFDVLIRLHAKACLVSKEILCLLKNGFADGAHARWRALHEITVTALFISKNGSDIAEKFYFHSIVDSYKGASQHKQYSSRLQAAPPSEEDLENLKVEYDRALERFGADFSSPYGWAHRALNKKKVSFSDIEKSVNYDHWRPYYKWASQNIHSNAKTITSSLGGDGLVDDVLLAGSSFFGLVDPAHSMAISLAQITTVLLSQNPNIDGVIKMKIVHSLCDEVGHVFLECSQNVKN